MTFRLEFMRRGRRYEPLVAETFEEESRTASVNASTIASIFPLL